MKAPRIRTGIVGLGYWAQYGHLPALKLLPEYDITVLASRRPDHASAIARQFDIPSIVGDYRDLVTRPDVDFVVVLPPAPQHAEVARAAIAAGKDVYCEWPLTTTLVDSQDLLDRATKANARDRAEGTRQAPTFNDAVRMHRFINAISDASDTGQSKNISDIWEDQQKSPQAHTDRRPL